MGHCRNPTEDVEGDNDDSHAKLLCNGTRENVLDPHSRGICWVCNSREKSVGSTTRERIEAEHVNLSFCHPLDCSDDGARDAVEVSDQ